MKTVFVIDDDELMREMLTRLLEKTGCCVRSFPSPLHALPLIDSGHPDAIVSDVQMPGMNGLELTRNLRERGIIVPIVLVTADANAEVQREAHGLEVVEVFEKPIKDVPRLSLVLERAMSQRDEAEVALGLDRLRLSFLTGLAHELRTPLTAIKLALDSLFATPGTGLQFAQGELLAIGQRNIDRIIRLVEGQLDLLQITLGDVSVSRKLVCIRDVIEHAAGEISPRVRRSLDIGDNAGEERVFLFTDPDRLRAVVRYVLENGPHRRGDVVRVRFGVFDDTQQVRIKFENTRVPACTDVVTDPRPGEGVDSYAARDLVSADGESFEIRAFRRIVASLSGEIHISGGTGSEDVVLLFPLRPRFDTRDDLNVPVNRLREAAMLTGKSVNLLRCDVSVGDKNGASFSPGERTFFERCLSAISGDDAVVRDRIDGTYYLVLIERNSEEIDHMVRCLHKRSDLDDGAGEVVETTVLETFPAEVRHADESPVDLETVSRLPLTPVA